MSDESIELARTVSVGASPPTQEEPAPRRGRGDRLRRGDAVGRYVILGPLGAGGMGVVFAAFDPELDRRVAIKLLKSSRGSDDARARLLREAQAMARLQHPNVVAVYDVGTLGDRVWTAMELVEGRTLAALLAGGRPGWREALALMEAVGAGLKAAHAAGLVHRDVKPENVMIGGDGRVRVVDFGLAREEGGAAGARPDHADLSDLSIETSSRISGSSKDVLRTDITRDGALIGTPAYMAPEQFTGGAVDARTDVFAWCVAAWEAIYGERPFAGDGLASLVVAVTTGKVRPPPAGAAAPVWVRRILERGLRPDPEARWPSMAALLAAIERGRRRARRRWAVAGVVALAAVVGGGAAARAIDRERKEAACAAAGASIVATWDADAAAAIEAVFAASSWTSAIATWPHVRDRVDAYARAWGQARRQVCVAHTITGELTAEEAAARELCLGDLRINFAATVDLLRGADLEIVVHSVDMAARLPAIAECSDPLALARRERLHGDGRLDSMSARIRDSVLHQRVTRASALQWAGKYSAAREAMRALLPEVEGAEQIGARALVHYNLGVLERLNGDIERAVEHHRLAVNLAVRAGIEESASSGARALCVIFGDDLGRHEEAQGWCDLADAWIGHLDLGESLLHADTLISRSTVLFARGEHAGAQAAIEEALAIQRRVLGPDHPNLATTLNALGMVQEELGEIAAAEGAYAEALRIAAGALGPEHPELAKFEENLGNIAWVRGDLEGALARHRRALALRVAAGGDSSSIGNSHLNIGNIDFSRGDYRAAVDAYEEALATFERALGRESPRLGYALVNLGAARVALGELDPAQAALERALTIRERSLGSEHSDVAFVLVNLGDVRRDRGDLDAAAAYYDEALGIWERTLGPGHPYVPYALVGRAEVAARRGDHARARAELERALAIREAEANPGGIAEVLVPLGRARLALADAPAALVDLGRAVDLAAAADVPPEVQAAASFGLARALAAAGREPARARALALTARAAYQGAGAPRRRELAEVDAWLAAHP